MPMKRTSAKSTDDEQSNETSEVFEQDDNAKRAKRAQFSGDTMLQELPKEILEHILAEAVVMEVQSLKLAKIVWKKKAEPVISRLRTVCSQWNSILSTHLFLNKVHGILDGTAQETLHFDMLYQATIQLYIVKVASIKDEIFMLCRPENRQCFINVHDRNNMEEVKDVIPLYPGILYPVDMVACNMSNCAFVLNKDCYGYSVFRIKRDEEHEFNISPWENRLSLPRSEKSLFAAVNGGLIILSQQDSSKQPNPSVVSIYDANGSLQHALALYPTLYGFNYIFSVIQKSNGNLILATRLFPRKLDTVLKEINATGRIIRQTRSSMLGSGGVNVADADERIWTIDLNDKAELLDSEFNLLDFADPPPEEKFFHSFDGTHYNSERNEMACFYQSLYKPPDFASVLTIFNFTRE